VFLSSALPGPQPCVQLALNEGLELLLQAEAEERDHRRFKRLKQNAAFRYQASIEEIRMDPQRGVDKQLIYQLSPGDYIQKGESVLITGATG
jgi:DNA replication protein DnaC